MTEFMLSIVVDGPGTDVNYRSHWAFVLHKTDEDRGLLLHVSPIDLSRLIYQFDRRSDVIIRTRSSEGSFALANIAPQDVKRTTEIISQEPAPTDGVERCRDWVLRTVISLEAEELIPPGSSDWISRLVGESAQLVAQATGSRWTRTEE